MEYENHKKIVICYPQPKLDKSQISPKEFLKWAKSDLKKSQDKRALGNALGNIKKAIHSRIDEIINSTHIVLGSGWDWQSFPANQKLNILKDQISNGDII